MKLLYTGCLVSALMCCICIQLSTWHACTAVYLMIWEYAMLLGLYFSHSKEPITATCKLRSMCPVIRRVQGEHVDAVYLAVCTIVLPAVLQ